MVSPTKNVHYTAFNAVPVYTKMTTQNGVLVDIAEYANHILSKNLTQTQEVKYFFIRRNCKP